MTRFNLKISTALFCSLIAFSAKAQQAIVQKAIDKITSAKNISYNDTADGIEFFGSDVHSKHYLNLYGYTGDAFLAYKVDNYQGPDKYEYLSDGRQQLDLDFKDSTYTIADAQKRAWLSPLHDIIANIKDELAKPNCTVKQLADSAINKTACYHILIATEELVKKTYNRYHLFISKKNDLILGATVDLKGEASKEGMAIGMVTRNIHYVFSDFRIFSGEPKSPVTVSMPSGFKPEKKLQMLPKGTIAPQWTLTSTEGKILSMADLKGKVILMDFTFNGCAGCMLALPVIEKLHKKYDGTDVSIVSINFSDTKEAVAKFIKNNKIKSPIYVNGKPLAKIY